MRPDYKDSRTEARRRSPAPSIEIALLAACVFCLGNMEVSALESWYESPRKNPPPGYTISYNIVKTPLHFFIAEEHRFDNKERPSIVACYDGKGGKLPDRVLVSANDDGVYDQKFTREGSRCASCHFPFETPEKAEKRKFRYQMDV